MPSVPVQSDVDDTIPDAIGELVGEALAEHSLEPMSPAVVTNISGMGMHTVKIAFQGTLNLESFLRYGDEDRQMLLEPEGEVTLVEITHEALTLKVFRTL